MVYACLRNVLGTEIRDNSIDKIVPHDDCADRFPVAGVFAKQQADRLQRDFHNRRRIRHGANLHQMLFLYRFHRYTNNHRPLCSTIKKCAGIGLRNRKHSDIKPSA